MAYSKRNSLQQILTYWFSLFFCFEYLINLKAVLFKKKLQYELEKPFLFVYKTVQLNIDPTLL